MRAHLLTPARFVSPQVCTPHTLSPLGSRPECPAPLTPGAGLGWATWELTSSGRTGQAGRWRGESGVRESGLGLALRGLESRKDNGLSDGSSGGGLGRPVGPGHDRTCEGREGHRPHGARQERRRQGRWQVRVLRAAGRDSQGHRAGGGGPDSTPPLCCPWDAGTHTFPCCTKSSVPLKRGIVSHACETERGKKKNVLFFR